MTCLINDGNYPIFVDPVWVEFSMGSMQKLSLLLLFTLGLNAFALETSAPMPDLPMTDDKGVVHHAEDFKGNWVVLEWTNHDCPFVRKHYLNGDMQALQKEYTDKGVVWLRVISSAQGHQGYLTPEASVEKAMEQGAHATATILDASGKLGRTYNAKTTPHMFVFNPEGDLFYQGAIDSIRSVRPVDVAKAKNYVRMALDAGMEGENMAPISLTEAYGCGVKY